MTAAVPSQSTAQGWTANARSSYAEAARRECDRQETVLHFKSIPGELNRAATRRGRSLGLLVSGLLLLLVPCGLSLPVAAQTCTPQATMTADARLSIANAALGLASAIKASDVSRVEAMATRELTADFDPTAQLVRNTSAKIAADTLQVTQIYQLDASNRKAADTSETYFSCALTGSTDEVDFSIANLPAGVYAFAMVEARGARPWLLSLLLEQHGSGWQMAGFYPHARSAAGHDGLWYWKRARAEALAGHKWLAWVLYSEADQLLRPANFVTSTHLDNLRLERHKNAPNELSDGISDATPLAIRGKDGAEFAFTDLGSAGTDDGKGLDLVLHYKAEPIADPAAATARNAAAAKALLDAHPELRGDFTEVSVFSESAGQLPFATLHKFSELQ